MNHYRRDVSKNVKMDEMDLEERVKGGKLWRN